MDTINSVSTLSPPLLALISIQTFIKDVKTRVTKSSQQIKLVMTSPWTITSHTVTHSVHLDKNISLTSISLLLMIQSVQRNVVTPVPGYPNRQIPTSRILTCVKTPVRPPTDIARPAPMRNILGVSGTMLQSAFILISGVMVTQSVTE